MPSFINFWTLHTMTLQTAIESQTPDTLTIYAYDRNRHCFEQVDTVPTLSEDEARMSELNEQVRRITHDQRFPCEFADEMSDAEAERGMACIVWQVDGHEFSNPQIIGVSNGR